jgi:UPF0755 protein
VSDDRGGFDDDLDPPDWVSSGASTPGRSEPQPPRAGAPRRRQAATPPRSRRTRPRPPTGDAPDDHTGPPAATQTLERDPHPPADELGPDEPGGSSRASRRAAERAARAGRKRRRRRNIAALAIVLGLVLPFLVVGGWFVYQLNPPGGPGKVVQFEINKGWGSDEIGDALEDKGIVGSSLAFQVYVKVRGAGPFQPGPYELRSDLGVRDAVEKLEGGPVQGASDLELTLPPGLTIEQIADRVADQLPGRDRTRFLEATQSGEVRSKYQPPEVTSLEGLLYPDTYLISENENEADIVRRLVETFDAKADEVGLANAPTTTGRTPYETIVIGSLIEREAGVEEDRVLISAAIANRLRDGNPLQIDATLCYIKGGCTEPLTNTDKELDSPYNTYRVTTLPPTPISSVGEASLRAALAPADVPYKFWVLIDSSGKSKFAATAEEHEGNVAEARANGVL